MSHSTALGQVLRFLPTRCLTSPAPASSDWKQDMGSWGPEKSLGGGGAGDLDVNPSLLFLAGAKRKKRKRNLAIEPANRTKYRFQFLLPDLWDPRSRPSAPCSPAVSLDTTLPGLRSLADSLVTAASCSHIPLRNQACRLSLTLHRLPRCPFQLTLGSAASSSARVQPRWIQGNSKGRWKRRPRKERLERNSVVGKLVEKKRLNNLVYVEYQ